MCGIELEDAGWWKEEESEGLVVLGLGFVENKADERSNGGG